MVQAMERGRAEDYEEGGAVLPNTPVWSLMEYPHKLVKSLTFFVPII